jgi:hypothetical protein
MWLTHVEGYHIEELWLDDESEDDESEDDESVAGVLEPETNSITLFIVAVFIFLIVVAFLISIIAAFLFSVIIVFILSVMIDREALNSMDNRSLTFTCEVRHTVPVSLTQVPRRCGSALYIQQ